MPSLSGSALRVAPIGNVDVETRKQPLDGSTKQGREVTRHRRDDQQSGPSSLPLTNKILELAERLAHRTFSSTLTLSREL